MGPRRWGACFVGTLVAAVLSAGAGAALAHTVRAPVKLRTTHVHNVFVLHAADGQLNQATRSASYRLVLGGVGQSVARMPTNEFLAAWATLGFTKVPPAAVLRVTGAKGRRAAAEFVLTRPAFTRGRVSFQARVIHRLRSNLQRLRSQLGGRLPRRFASAVLYIDQEQARVAGGCVHGTSCQPLSCIIQPYATCPNVDLSGTDLTGADLSHANLSGANLSNAILRQANLYGAQLTGANLESAHASNADLAQATLNRAHLEFTSLIGANLNQVKASNAKMHNVFLEQANLYRATLNNDDLSGTQSFDVNLVFATLQNDNFSGGVMFDANLARASVYNADFANATFVGANFSRAVITNSNFTSTDLVGSNLLGTALGQNTFCHTQMPDGSTNNANCPPAP